MYGEVDNIQIDIISKLAAQFVPKQRIPTLKKKKTWYRGRYHSMNSAFVY